MSKKIMIPLILFGLIIGFFLGYFFLFENQEQRIKTVSTTWADSEKESSKEEIKEEKTYKVLLENIEKEENKVNIYLFYGEGCPHCEKELAFFEKIKEEYGDFYNLYTFETWHNEENKKWMEVFASSMKDTVRGVPYTIIGEKSYIGFKESLEEEFYNAINNESKNNFDVYLDKIKS